MLAFAEWQYSGLSGGRTTVDADFQISAPSMAQNPYAVPHNDASASSSPWKSPIDPNPPDPQTQLPLGDAVIPLLLFALGYVFWKRRALSHRSQNNVLP